jgi:hypothetical protein
VNEVDDRLAGDLVWELFPQRAAVGAAPSLFARSGRWLVLACIVAVCWLFDRSLAVLIVCLGVAEGDFRHAWRIMRSIPDKAGGTICALFACAWGAWKIGVTAVVFMFLSVFLGRKQAAVPPAFLTSALLVAGGYVLSAALTAVGLARAYRAEMRVWIGEGVNRARTLLLGMLIVGFTVGVLGPLCVWLSAAVPARNESNVSVGLVVGAILALAFIGPVIMLLILDWLSRRVVADRPSKLGPKIPTVGKL